MTIIPLTQGKTAIIDDEDFDKVSKFKWCAHKIRYRWYASAYVKGTGRDGNQQIALHRLVVGAKIGEQVDHKDNDGLNCRKNNLRKCDRFGNARNKEKPRNNKSGFKGVFFWKYKKLRKPWSAKISCRGKTYYLGSFSCKKGAARAYNKAAKKYFGEFARLNVIKQ